MNHRRSLLPGFTMVELMIVVAIIGILAIIAVPRFGNLVVKAHEASVRSRLGAIRSAMNIYYADLQSYPTDLQIGLTTGNKYLEPITGAVIPAVPAQNNPGHDGPATVASVVDDMATGSWAYITTSNVDDGSAMVNCTHKDSKGSVWSSY